MTDTGVNALLRRDRAIVIAAIITISLLAWAYVLWLAALMNTMEISAPATSGGMGGMNMPSGSGSMIG